MCYSAQIEAAYQKLVRMTGATVSLQEFAALYAHDPGKRRPKTPKAMDDAFRAGASAAERAVWAEIQQWNQAEATILEQELFANRKRLADAERSLQAKETKKAREDVRIAGNKIERAMGRLADLKRAEGKDRDSRIFPGVYAPGSWLSSRCAISAGWPGSRPTTTSVSPAPTTPAATASRSSGRPPSATPTV